MSNLRLKLAVKVRDPFQRWRRKRRMALFVDRMGLKGGEKIVDLGGSARFWADLDVPLDLTIVNLPGILSDDISPPQHQITRLEGDACATGFDTNSYDIVFSNSVIEHVGDESKQKAFAGEVHRLAPRHWVQTPSIWFPIEAHNHMPFWWFYPKGLQDRLKEGWRRRLPAWTEMIDGTTVLLRRDLEAFFPTSQIWTERVAGIPKSYVVWRGGAGERT